jgi:hypothetical protein
MKFTLAEISLIMDALDHLQQSINPEKQRFLLHLRYRFFNESEVPREPILHDLQFKVQRLQDRVNQLERRFARWEQ